MLPFVLAVLFLASASDTGFAQPIAESLAAFGIPTETVIASAHKAPERVLEHLQRFNARTDPTVVIAVAGLSNGLAGMIAGSCIHPVIACPAFKDRADYLTNIHSSLQLPSDVPALTILHPTNAALAAVKILASSDASLRRKVEEHIARMKAGYTAAHGSHARPAPGTTAVMERM